jgi:proteasome accessory factor A
MEMECGFAVVTPDGASGNCEEALNRFGQLLHRLEPNLSGRESGGCFLQFGGRFYFDCGHPEITTPECSSPEEIVRYKLAAEAVLVRVARALNEELAPKARVVLFGNNFDYITGNTWGCHESYLHQADPDLFPQHLIPHLVSRIVFTGVGGFGMGHVLQFLVSPRVAWLTQDVSGDSTHSRGILHTRDESLSGRSYKRAHLLCGENNRSQLATYLKMGTTALVILLIEQGHRPGNVVGLASPLAAMRAFSEDPTCRAKVCTFGNRRLTAVQIQRHYLDLAKSCLDRPFMPAWAPALCARWEDTLDRLARPESLRTCLDWPLKFDLYRQFAATRGFDWDEVRRPHRRPATPEPEADDALAELEALLRAAGESPQALAREILL